VSVTTRARARAAAVSAWALVRGWAQRRWLLALGAYIVCAVAVTWPLARRMGSATYGGPGDGWATIWQTWERTKAGVPYFSTDTYENLAAPFGTVTSTAAFLSNASTELPNALLLKLGVGDVAAYNVLTLSVIVLSSLAMYAAVRRFGCSPAVAFWAGLVYMVAPWHLEKASIHVTLSLMAWIPLAVLGIVEFTRRPGMRSGALLAGACILGAYTHVYYGFMAILLLIAAVPIILVAASARRDVLRTLRTMAFVAVAMGVAVLPLAIALRLQREDLAMLLARPLYLMDLASAGYRYALPSIDNPIFGGAVADHIANRGLEANRGELALYLGWLTVALAVVALVGAVRGRVPRLPALTAGAALGIGLILSLPARIDLPIVGGVDTPVFYLQRAVDFISTPSRFFALTLTGLVILGALGLQWLRSFVPVRRVALAAVAAVCVLSVAELVVSPSGRVVSTTPPDLVPAIEAHVPAGAALAQYPSTDRSLRPVADQLFWQISHGHPLMNGASVGTPEDRIRNEISLLQDDGIAGRLALLGLEWITVDPALYQFAPLQSYPAEVVEDDEGRGWRTEVVTPSGARIMRVTAAPAPGLAARAQGFFFETGQESTWMDGAAAGLLVCATRPGVHRLEVDAGAFARPRVLRVGDAPPARVPAVADPIPLSLPVTLAAGWQWVDVRVTGSTPDRPVDLVPGSTDDRELTAWLGPASVTGPSGGDPTVCRGQLPEVPARYSAPEDGDNAQVGITNRLRG